MDVFTNQYFLNQLIKTKLVTMLSIKYPHRIGIIEVANIVRGICSPPEWPILDIGITITR
jgi:hypothetical protein